MILLENFALMTQTSLWLKNKPYFSLEVIWARKQSTVYILYATKNEGTRDSYVWMINSNNSF